MNGNVFEYGIIIAQIRASNSIIFGISKCSFMEVLVVHAREHLNVTTSNGGTPLHFAAYHGHTQVCSLLAAQVKLFQLQ